MSAEAGRGAFMIAGTAIGAYFGNPALGFALGNLAGGLIFPNDEGGSRLNDLRVMTSAWGSPIAIGYGTFRIGSNLIWSPGITGKSVSSKGSSGDSTQYDYKCTFAVAFAEGVADDILTIWADSQVIYNKVPAPTGLSPLQLTDLAAVIGGSAVDTTVTPGQTYVANTQVLASVGGTKKESLQFRFYTGAEDQMPDPAIQAQDGADLTPAHRGLCYMVFDDLPLAQFGNRVPQISALITFDEAQTYPIIAAQPTVAPASSLPAPTLITNHIPQGYVACDWNNLVGYTTGNGCIYSMNLITGVQTTLCSFETIGVEVLGQSLFNGGVSSNGFGLLGVTSDGNVVFGATIEEGHGGVMGVINPNTGKLISSSYSTTGKTDGTALSSSTAGLTAEQIQAGDTALPDPATQITGFGNATETLVGDQGAETVLVAGALVPPLSGLCVCSSGSDDYALGLSDLGHLGVVRLGKPTLFPGPGPAETTGIETVWFDYEGTYNYDVFSRLMGAYGAPPVAASSGSSTSILSPTPATVYAVLCSTTWGVTTPYPVLSIQVSGLSEINAVGVPTGSTLTEIFTIDPAVLGAQCPQTAAAGALQWSANGQGSSESIFFDLSDNSLIFSSALANSTGQIYRLIYKIGVGNAAGDYDWIVYVDPALYPHVGNLPGGNNASFNIASGQVSWLSGSGFCITLQTATGTLSESLFPIKPGYIQAYVEDIEAVFLVDGYGSAPSEDDGGATAGDTATNATISAAAADGAALAFVNRAGGSYALLSDVLTDLCVRAGYTADDIDVSECVLTYVDGYFIGRPSSVHDSIAVLAKIHQFDACESDNKIVFRMLIDSIPLRSINDDDILLNKEDATFVKETRQQDVDLPAIVEIRFMDPTNDNQENLARARRLAAPTPTMYSRNNVRIEAPMVIDPNVAAQTAATILQSSWNQRSAYEISLTYKHLDLDPCDTVVIALSDGSYYTCRLNNIDFGANMELQCKGISLLPVAYLPATSTGDAPLYIPTPPTSAIATPTSTYTSPARMDVGRNAIQTIELIGPTKLFVLDLPLLRDTDTTGAITSAVYVAAAGMGSTAASWAGASVEVSSDGTSFGEFAQITEAIVWGSCVTPLPDVDEVYSLDTKTQLVVSLDNPSATLASTTLANVLDNYANMFAVQNSSGGWEVINVVSCAQQADGTWLLTGLLRGRRGTDTQAATHGSGDTIVYLDPEKYQVIDVALSTVNTPRTYQATSYEQSVGSPTVVSVTTTAADLKPYAPVAVVASLDGSNDIVLTWLRRTRLGGDLAGTFGTPDIVPLAETSEAYSIDILSGPGGSVVRTLTSSTPTVTYPNSEVVADFGAVPAQISVNVYQLSSVIGRGFTNPVTVTIGEALR